MPGCLFILLFSGLQTWLFVWSTWDNPHFWFIQLAYFSLSVLSAITSNALKAQT